MKTKALLLLCFLAVMATAQLSAQNGKNGNGSVSFVVTAQDYWQPVYDSKTGGEVIDMIYGTVDLHVVWHFTGSENVWAKWWGFGEGYSENTGEIFTIKEADKMLDWGEFTSFHFELKGNQGSHYVGTGTIDYIYDNGELSDIIVENLKFISTGKPKLNWLFK